MCLTTRSKAGFLITAPLTTVKHSDRYPSWVYELMFHDAYSLFYCARREKGFGIVSCESTYALKGPWDQIAMDIHNGFKEGDYVSQSPLLNFDSGAENDVTRVTCKPCQLSYIVSTKACHFCFGMWDLEALSCLSQNVTECEMQTICKPSQDNCKY